MTMCGLDDALKYIAFKILLTRVSGLTNNIQAWLASSVRLKISKSLKPILPVCFPLQRVVELVQWIVLSSMDKYELCTQCELGWCFRSSWMSLFNKLLRV